MSKNHTPFIVFSLLLLLAIFVFYFFSGYLIKAQPRPVVLTPEETIEETPLVDKLALINRPFDPVRGKVDSTVIIYEFGDFQCPFCVQAEEIVNQVFSQY